MFTNFCFVLLSSLRGLLYLKTALVFSRNIFRLAIVVRDCGEL